MRDDDCERQRKETATDRAGDRKERWQLHRVYCKLQFVINVFHFKYVAGAGTVGGVCLLSVNK